MKDMVEVLLQYVRDLRLTSNFTHGPTSRLKNVSDPKQTGPDGQTIKGRMEELCEAASEDIKNCANTCDTYLK